MVQLRFAHDGYVAALTRLVLSDKSGLVCMIRVFMDESGVHDGTDYVSVSVVWAEDTQWPAWSNA